MNKDTLYLFLFQSASSFVAFIVAAGLVTIISTIVNRIRLRKYLK